MLGDSREHLWTDVIAVMECEDIAWPPFALQNLVRAFLPSDAPEPIRINAASTAAAREALQSAICRYAANDTLPMVRASTSPASS
jgi:hypothetical protein